MDGSPPAHLCDDALRMVLALAGICLQQSSMPSYDVAGRLLFHLVEFAGDFDDRVWALFMWGRDFLRFFRFAHFPNGVFQYFKKAFHDMILATPAGRLLAWEDRMQTAHQLAHYAATSSSPMRHTLEAWVNPTCAHASLFERVHVRVEVVPACSRVPVTYENGTPVLWLLHSPHCRVGFLFLGLYPLLLLLLLLLLPPSSTQPLPH